MDFIAVLDIASFIWDKDDFKNNSNKYYKLSDQLLEVIGVFNQIKPSFLLRDELLSEMIKGFPFHELPTNFYDFGTVVYSFLGNLGNRIYSINSTKMDKIFSDPNLLLDYYTSETKEEIIILISDMHSIERNIIYFTFHLLWNSKRKQLKTIADSEKNYETIIYKEKKDLDLFYNKFKRIFEHNPKHDIRSKNVLYSKGRPVAPLTSSHKKAQELLDSAIGEDGNVDVLYNYDEEARVFIKFRRHLPNKYHAYDVSIDDVPLKIKNRFYKR